MFYFRGITLFCLGYCFTKHKITICSSLWGGYGPQAPLATLMCWIPL